MNICHYGCGKIAKFQLKNGNWCCSEFYTQCEAKKNYGKKNGNYKRKFSKKTIQKLKDSLRGKGKLTINDYKEKHPFFYEIEGLKIHPETGEIQVHCKNHKCKNSKEQDGWFTPTSSQISERIRQLEHPEGNDGSYFYCCDECKQDCPLYNNKITSIYNTAVEYNAWRNEVFRRQEKELGYNECEICGNAILNELIVHHEKPKKINFILSLDPDNGIILCGANSKNKCHYKYGHKDECSTVNIANKICI